MHIRGGALQLAIWPIVRGAHHQAEGRQVVVQVLVQVGWYCGLIEIAKLQDPLAGDNGVRVSQR